LTSTTDTLIIEAVPKNLGLVKSSFRTSTVFSNSDIVQCSEVVYSITGAEGQPLDAAISKFLSLSDVDSGTVVIDQSQYDGNIDGDKIPAYLKAVTPFNEPIYKQFKIA
jgi:hypothetical protein